MELRHLRYFVAAAEEQHFGRAARRIGIAQPALSRQIGDLERAVGCPLFERLPRGVRLNPAGAGFLEDARATLTAVEAACVRARRAHAGELGRLTVGFDEAASWNGVVPAGFAAFREARPDAVLDLVPLASAAQTAALADGEIDAGFLYDLPPGARDVSAVRVALHGVMLALPAGHEKAAAPAVALAAFGEERFVHLAREAAPRAYGKIQGALDQAGVAPATVVEAPSESALLGLVAGGAGVAIVNAEARWRRPDNVALVALSDVSVVLPLYFAWRPENRAPLLDAFRTIVIKESRPAQVGQPL